MVNVCAKPAECSCGNILLTTLEIVSMRMGRSALMPTKQSLGEGHRRTRCRKCSCGNTSLVNSCRECSLIRYSGSKVRAWARDAGAASPGRGLCSCRNTCHYCTRKNRTVFLQEHCGKLLVDIIFKTSV